MALEKIRRIRGRGVHVPGDNIDTDQIIPARFLRCVTFDALGAQLFRDARPRADGALKPHPLDDRRHAGASVMLSGRNFGCGSSREHAAQALHKAGFRAILAEDFAEIFLGNASTLGIPCLTMTHGDIQTLAVAVEADPGMVIEVDLEAQRVRAGEALLFVCGMPASTRDALLQGAWDPIAQLLEGRNDVDAVHEVLPYTRW